MKTLFFALTLSLLGQHAWADANDDLNHAVLQSLVANASKITLISEVDNKPLEAEWQLPSLIASFLSHGYASLGGQDYIVLGNVIVNCKASSHRENRYACNVNFLDGDFAVSQKGTRFEGPESESSVSFQVPVERDAEGHLHLLGRKFKAMMAG
jgi:hypothetical protein